MELPISNRENFIVNADDFGINHRASRNILFLVSLGKIDRVSVMLDGEMSDKEILELLQSGVKIDIHLSANLHTRPGRNNTSTFWRVMLFVWHVCSRKITRKKMLLAWETQIHAFRERFGKNPDGINSHEHIHFYPPLFAAVLELQEKFTIPYVRFGFQEKNSYGTTIGFMLLILRKLNSKQFISSPAVSSHYLTSLDWIHDIKTFLEVLPEGQTEIVCHPERAQEFVLMKDEF